MRVIWTGHVACMDKMRNAYKILVGKFQGKRSLGRATCKWKVNIKMDLRDPGCEDVKRIQIAQHRKFVNTIMNLWMQ
jgi:hypothetical protein